MSPYPLSSVPSHAIFHSHYCSSGIMHPAFHSPSSFLILAQWAWLSVVETQKQGMPKDPSLIKDSEDIFSIELRNFQCRTVENAITQRMPLGGNRDYLKRKEFPQSNNLEKRCWVNIKTGFSSARLPAAFMALMCAKLLIACCGKIPFPTSWWLRTSLCKRKS